MGNAENIRMRGVHYESRWAYIDNERDMLYVDEAWGTQHDILYADEAWDNQHDILYADEAWGIKHDILYVALANTHFRFAA